MGTDFNEAINDLCKSIDHIYDIIITKEQAQKITNAQRGIDQKRIPFEEVDLGAELESLLIPLLPLLIDLHPYLRYENKRKAYKVYIASLCEVVKHGLVNGGILKTLENRIGAFDYNHHYALLRPALQYEGIELVNKHRRYEETIINEAGIPRGYRRKTLDFFSIYWKWLRNCPVQERMQFLSEFINNKALDKEYIADISDKRRIKELREDTSDFGEKIIRTCQKLDKVYSAIDEYPDVIDEENIRSVIDEISDIVEFNVLSVVRTNEIIDYILDYVKKLSFHKFSRMLNNMPSNEVILLPNGVKKRTGDYFVAQYIGGKHFVRGNAYDVSYPLALSVDEIFALPQQTIKHYGPVVIYTSEDPIDVEIDGYSKPCRTFINSRKQLLYVYSGRIPVASFAYIDGIPLFNDKQLLFRAYISKYWDLETRQYSLCLYISEIRYVDPHKAMCHVNLELDGHTLLNEATNRNGSFRKRDKIIELEPEILWSTSNLAICVDGEVIEEKNIELADLYIWAKQSGLRIRDKIELSEWIGSYELIVFSKYEVLSASVPVCYLYMSEGFYVYSTQIDPASCSLVILDTEIQIAQATHPFLSLKSKFDILSEKRCLGKDIPISIEICNLEEGDNNAILIINHELESISYNASKLSREDLADIGAILPQSIFYYSKGVGPWYLSLVYDGNKVSEIDFTVIPRIEVIPNKGFYMEGEQVGVTVKSDIPCFESGNEYSDSIAVELGIAKLQIRDNYVHTQPYVYECWVDRCEVNMNITYKPKVWALRTMSSRTQWWDNAMTFNLTYDQLKEKSVFICSTTDVQIAIRANEKLVNRYVVPGYNKLNIYSMFESWKPSNQLSFVDSSGAYCGLTIIYPPRIIVSNIVYEDMRAVAQVQYFGPANVALELRVFLGKNVITTISRNAYQNRFPISVYIDRGRCENRTITIEARTDGQDFQCIFTGILEFPKPILKQQHMLPVELNITASTSLLDLLSYGLIMDKDVQPELRSNSLVEFIS